LRPYSYNQCNHASHLRSELLTLHRSQEVMSCLLISCAIVTLSKILVGQAAPMVTRCVNSTCVSQPAGLEPGGIAERCDPFLMLDEVRGIRIRLGDLWAAFLLSPHAGS